MTFLAPMAGIIGAAVAVPLLLALYLLKLRRRPIRVSSTLLWEQAAQDLQVNVPLRMLRWSWLLLLHLVTLACFLLAVARPAMGEGGVIGERVVIIIDRSASMNATDLPPASPEGPPRSRLDAAKRRANELIDAIGRSGAGGARPRCLVMSMAATPRALTAFTPDLRALREAVDAISPTDQPDDLAAALRLIDAMTVEASAGDDGLAAKPTVYLITDGVVIPPTPLQRRGLNPIVLNVAPLPVTEPLDPRIDNVGIVAVSAVYDIDDQEVIRVFARLINSGQTDVMLATRCTVDGQLPSGGVGSVKVPGATLDADGLTVPGEAAAIFSIRPSPSTQARTLLVSISRPDTLAADDAAGIVISPLWRPRVLVVAPDPQPPATAPEADVFLLQALDAAEPASLRVIAASDVQPNPDTPGWTTAPSPWVGADIIVFDRVEAPGDTLPSVPTLSFGAGLPQVGLTVIAPAEMIPSRSLSWKRDHPSLQYVSLDTLLVAPGMSIRSVPPPASAPPIASVVPLAEGTNGPLIVEVSHRSTANRAIPRIVVSFDLARSNWGPDVSFPLFIGNTIQYFSVGADGPHSASTSRSTIDTVSVDVPDESRGIIATGPLDTEFQLPGNGAASRSVRVGPFERAGVYVLKTTDGRPASPGVAVINLASERESLLQPLLAQSAAPSGGGVWDGQNGGPREVWHWFILAALFPLTVEWFVYAWRMRG
jgi:hypothetical protein